MGTGGHDEKANADAGAEGASRGISRSGGGIVSTGEEAGGGTGSMGGDAGNIGGAGAAEPGSEAGAGGSRSEHGSDTMGTDDIEIDDPANLNRYRQGSDLGQATSNTPS